MVFRIFCQFFFGFSVFALKIWFWCLMRFVCFLQFKAHLHGKILSSIFLEKNLAGSFRQKLGNRPSLIYLLRRTEEEGGSSCLLLHPCQLAILLSEDAGHWPAQINGFRSQKRHSPTRSGTITFVCPKQQLNTLSHGLRTKLVVKIPQAYE